MTATSGPFVVAFVLLCTACTTKTATVPQGTGATSTTATTGMTGAAPASSQNGNGAQGSPATAQEGNTGTPLAHNANAAPYLGTLGGPGNGYRFVGRFDLSNPQAVRFSLPNSKFGATFTGDTLGLMLQGDGTDFLSVSIDNGPEHVVATAPTTAMTLYPVATGLGAGPHTAWIVKRTEAYEVSQVDPNVHTGTLSFGGFALSPNGALGAPPAPRSHLVVALGDSAFTGYGVGQLITDTVNCVFTPDTQNALLSVPAKLADLLDAEIINVSASGKGVAASAYDPTNPNNQLPALWQMVVPFAKTPAYGFEAEPVDAILFGGGSDDLVGDYGNGAFADTGVFIAKYTALLADMRAHYPTATLLGIITPNAIAGDKAALTQAITAAVNARTAAGDSRVFAFDYFAQDPNGPQNYTDADAALGLGRGCQGHPSDAGSAFLAKRLADFLHAHPSP
jgi:hypothetical protein